MGSEWWWQCPRCGVRSANHAMYYTSETTYRAHRVRCDYEHQLMAKKPPKPPRVDDSDALLDPPFEGDVVLDASRWGKVEVLPSTQGTFLAAKDREIEHQAAEEGLTVEQLLAPIPAFEPAREFAEGIHVLKARILTLIDALEQTLKGRDLGLADIRALRSAVEKL